MCTSHGSACVGCPKNFVWCKRKGQCVKWVVSIVHTRICHYLCGGHTLFGWLPTVFNNKICVDNAQASVMRICVHV